MVDQSGLPQSRLMELQTPKLSQKRRRKIVVECLSVKKQKIEAKPRVPERGAPAVGTGSSAASSGAFKPWDRISSGIIFPR